MPGQSWSGRPGSLGVVSENIFEAPDLGCGLLVDQDELIPSAPPSRWVVDPETAAQIPEQPAGVYGQRLESRDDGSNPWTTRRLLRTTA